MSSQPGHAHTPLRRTLNEHHHRTATAPCGDLFPASPEKLTGCGVESHSGGKHRATVTGGSREEPTGHSKQYTNCAQVHGIIAAFGVIFFYYFLK